LLPVTLSNFLNMPEFGDNDIQYDIMSVTTSNDNASRVSGNKTKNKKVYDTKRGHHLIHRRVLKKDGKWKRVPVEIFTTRCCIDARIRNAVTGIYEPDAFVGRHSEEQYFKVVLATGELGANAPSSFLYFDSPSQFERHFFTDVDMVLKKKWHDRNVGVLPILPNYGAEEENSHMDDEGNIFESDSPIMF
jgi:hypothetical protein